MDKAGNTANCYFRVIIVGMYLPFPQAFLLVSVVRERELVASAFLLVSVVRERELVASAECESVNW